MNPTSNTIADLQHTFNPIDGVSFVQNNELVSVQIKNAAASAEIFLQGAQITAFQPNDKEPVIFLSDDCTYKQGSPLRGGIPICWPWFGDLDKNPELLQEQIPNNAKAPAHGFVRDRDWTIATISSPTASSTIVELTLLIAAEEEFWPFATQLTYTVEVGETITATLRVENKGDKTFTYSQALHTYFQIDSINELKIPGFDNSPYIDGLDSWQSKVQTGDITFSAEVDRIYQTAPSPIHVNNSWLKAEGASSNIVWNPWIEKAIRLSQFSDDDYLKMVCIESANTLDGCITLAPNEKHSLTIELGLS